MKSASSKENDDHPKGEIAQIGVHPVSFMAAAGTAAGPSGKLRANSRPSPLQSRCRGGSCQGNPGNSRYQILPPRVADFASFFSFQTARAAAARRAGARSIASLVPPRVTSAPAKGAPPVRRVVGIGALQRLVEGLELAELERSLVAGASDRAAEQPQGHLRGQAVAKWPASNTIGPRSDHGAGDRTPYELAEIRSGESILAGVLMKCGFTIEPYPRLRSKPT